MSTLLTKGLGYDEASIIRNVIAHELVGHVEVESRLLGTVVVEPLPIATVIEDAADNEIVAYVEVEPRLLGTVVVETPLVTWITCVLREDGQVMTIEGNKITMFIRDDRTLSVVVNLDTGTPVNLTGAKIWFTVKSRSTDTDASALILKKNVAAGGDNSQIKITVGAEGKAEIYIVPADTTALNPGTYLYDIQITLASGKTYTVVRDKFTLKEDVTKATV